MPGEKDKKITYKILTAEDLLKGEEPALKEIEPKKTEEVKPQVVEKVEVEPEVKEKEVKPPPKAQVSKIEVPPEKLTTGVFYPQEGIKEPSRKEWFLEISYPETKEEAPSVPLKRPEETEKISTKKVAEEFKKEEISKKEAEPKIFYRPKQEKPLFVLRETIGKTKTSRTTIFSFQYLNYIFLFFGSLLAIVLIFIFKPYEKLLTLLPKKETKMVEEVSLPPSPTQPTITFPSPPPSPTPSPSVIPSTPSPEIIEETKETILPSFQPVQELLFVGSFPSRSIQLSSLEEFEKSLKKFLAEQDYPASLVYLHFSFNNQPLPFEAIFNYFIKPTKMPPEKIKSLTQEFTGNYALMLYYGYTRKYPILIFEIKNPKIVKELNQEWEKRNMVNDFKNLFLEVNPGKLLSPRFMDKEMKKNPYRVVYFENNYQFLWLVRDKYLIYSTTEKGLEKILLSLIKND